MVLMKKNENQSSTRSYDDLDAINDFILTYEENNDIEKQSDEEVHNKKEHSLSSQISESTNMCIEAQSKNNDTTKTSNMMIIEHNIHDNNSDDENKVNISQSSKEYSEPINMSFDSVDSKTKESADDICYSFSELISDDFQKVFQGSFRAGQESDHRELSGNRESVYKESVYKEPVCKESANPTSINDEPIYKKPVDKESSNQDTQSTISTNFVIRKVKQGAKFIITRSDKVIECNISKINNKKPRKPIIKTTVYNIGRVSAENILNNNRKTTVYESKDIFGERIPLYDNLRKEDTSTKIVDVLEIVKNDHSDDEIIKNRFFVGKTSSLLHILEAKDYSDFKHKDLYDSIQKKGNSGIITTNYVKLENSQLICFKSKQIKRIDLDEDKLFFEDPYNINLCYPEKYTIDLIDSKLYIVTGNKFSLLKSVCCYGHGISKDEIYDITELELQRIDTKNSKFTLSFDKGDRCELVEIKHLDFVIFKDNEYYWFRCNNANTFLKWIVCIQVRRL